MKTGVLLINIGTPERPVTSWVKKYLQQFLSDPRVIDINRFKRWLLLKCIILPFRAKKSAQAYASIWRNEGSPLLYWSQKLQTALAEHLGPSYQVELGMRYGEPSIQSSLDNFSSPRYEKIIILPLFPQYSSAATGSAIEEALNHIKRRWNIPALTVISDFYQHPDFIAALADNVKRHLSDFKADHIVFSYHGLPERHIIKSEGQLGCDKIGPCPSVAEDNRYCYRAQCYATTRLVAQALNLAPQSYSVSFQSRLGASPWIKPYTDEVLPQLAMHGIKNIAVVCPSFVSDCLETLEEMGIRAKDQWLKTEGNQFKLIPCLNTDPLWLKALANMIRSPL